MEVGLLQVSTFVRASDIEGVGVFAAQPIKSGTVIWRFDSQFDLRIPVEKYRSAPRHLRELLERYAYPSPDRPGHLVYETDNGRFMNHSPSPNTDFSRFGEGTATADIAAGDELTCDYGQFYEDFTGTFDQG